ncbi:GNAT family N-acetyltransferase [Oceaniglobus roseus]|uniref:GNAT family N-acetyltransferase n=1 Tax=Oceaniglobus roseus TaxID=1737570 RepID=UPI000C7EBE24|nr:N-acetyltransferase [Kandeliimicrobium roseum]
MRCPPRLRPATADDASSLAALSVEVWLSTYIRRGINAHFADYALAEFTAARFAARLADPKETFTVSCNAEGIDGFLRLTDGSRAPVEGCSDTEIATLYVQPRHQGRGIGAALLSAALDQCRAAGAPAPWLAVNAENDAALRFYTAHGFHVAGETRFSFGGQSYPNLILSRRLGA